MLNPSSSAPSTLKKFRRTYRAFNSGDNLAAQRRTKLFNVLLAIIGIGASALLVITQIRSLNQLDFVNLMSELAGLAVIFSCYLLNRLGYTSLAALIFFVAINLIIILFLINLPDSRLLLNIRSIPTLLIVPVVAAGVIMRPVYSFVFAAISIISIVVIGLSRANPNIPSFDTPAQALSELDVPIILLFIMAGLSWYFEKTIQSLVSQLTTQNKNLDRVNQELAQKREIELQLSQKVEQLTKQAALAFDEQNLSSNDQIAAVLKVSHTTEQLNQISDAIAHVATQVDDTAQQALEGAEEGADYVRSSLLALSVFSNQTENMTRAMENLNQQASQIDQITEFITELAEETNLLALNAKIEAAGAGQYGRRFATVADQVQRLAHRSQEASGQVRQVVEEVRRAVETSVRETKKGAIAAAEIAKGTHSIERTLEDIVARAGNTAVLARQISFSTHEQRNATVEVVDSMRLISQSSRMVAHGSEEVLESLQQLKRAVISLNNITLDQKQPALLARAS